MIRDVMLLTHARSSLEKYMGTPHLLLAFLQIEKDEFVIRKATFGKSQADTIGVGRTASAI